MVFGLNLWLCINVGEFLTLYWFSNMYWLIFRKTDKHIWHLNLLFISQMSLWGVWNKKRILANVMCVFSQQLQVLLLSLHGTSQTPKMKVMGILLKYLYLAPIAFLPWQITRSCRHPTLAQWGIEGNSNKYLSVCAHTHPPPASTSPRSSPLPLRTRLL